MISLTAAAVIAASTVFGLGSPSYVSFAAGNPPLPPDPPTLTGVTATAGDRSILVQWDKPQNTEPNFPLLGYAFRLGLPEGDCTDIRPSIEGSFAGTPLEPVDSQLAIADEDATSFELTWQGNQTLGPLVNWETYCVEVSATREADPTAFTFGGEVLTVIPQRVPYPPVSTSISSPSEGTLRLAWQADAREASDHASDPGDPAGVTFEVAILDESTPPPSSPSDQSLWVSPVTPAQGSCSSSLAGTETTCDVTGLTPDKPYLLGIRVVNSAGKSNWVGVRGVPAAPAPPVTNPPSGGGQTPPASGGNQASSGSGGQAPVTGNPSPPPSTAPPSVSSPVLVSPRVTTPTPTPSPQTSGQTPSASGLSAAQSGPLATVGGQVVTVESAAISPTQLALQVGSVSLGVSVGNGSGTVGTNGSGANGSGAMGIQLDNGAATVFEGGGLTPGSTVQVVLPLAGDNSAVLAVIEVAEDGTFSGEAAFSTTPDGDPLPIGVRVVQLFTVDEDGNDVVIEVAVTIGQPDPTPAMNRADGSVPDLTPGEALGTSAGLPQVIEVRAIEEQKRAVVDGGAWSMAVDVASSTGGVQSVDSGAQLTLVRDESAMVSGSGFMAGTRADVWLFSEPTLLGTVTVDENGEFVGEVTIDGIVIPAGEHTLQLQGVGQDGYVKATSLGVAVDDVTAPMPSDTTSSSLWMLLLAIGGLAILLIAVFVIAVRRQMRKQ